MSLFSNFVSIIVAATTSFTSGIVDTADNNMKPPTEQVQTDIQSSIDEGTSIANSSGMNAGIAVIDRAKHNLMKTNAEPAHLQYPLESLGRLYILFYSIIDDSSVTDDKVPEIVSMMQGYSSTDTKKMWDKYGGKQIISELSERYNLQETTPKDTWGTSTASPVDVGRLYRRFLDDDRISTKDKKWAISLLRETSLEISGTNYSFGLPEALNKNNDEESSMDNNNEDDNDLAWAQGASSSGEDPMMRSTTGVLDNNMRYIVIIMGEVPNNTTDDNADSIISQVSAAVADNDKDNNKISEEQNDEEVKKFNKKMKKEYGDFVNIQNE